MILTGGTAVRLGGTDKAALEHAGRTLLERSLSAVAGAADIVVVGPQIPTSVPVRFVHEDPPGGGPLAGVAAGVATLDPALELIVVLAVDMPHVSAATVARLLDAAAGVDADAAWLTDLAGRRQLAGVVRRALVPPPDRAHGAPMRLLMNAGSVRDVPAESGEADDIDTWEDLARWRGEGGSGPRT